jgi:asparagine synthase (glutamine-hydrolysing)
MVSADGNLVVTYNGEIYNYRELRTELEQRDVTFRTGGDTEVLLHLYAIHGSAMVSRLRGMFAFAIWDERRRELFLARDSYGIKPLYTANDGWTFRFASQVKALLAGGRVSRDIEPAGVVGFRIFGHVPDPFTLFSEIRALPAGHTQRIGLSGPEEPRPFTNLAEIIAEAAATPLPAAALPEVLRAAALESVRAHLASDVEVGVFLSAGIDSGALLGLTRDAGHRDVRAITLAYEEFRGTTEDEAPLARRVAASYGARHSVRFVGQREFHDDLPSIMAAMDQPSIDGVNSWFVAKAANEAGLKVALSGLGGDELLAGYPSFADVPRWCRCFGPFAAIPGLGRLTRVALRATVPEFARHRPKALGLLQYASGWPGAYLLRRAVFLPDELREILDFDLVQSGLRRLRPLRGLAKSLIPDPGSNIGRICALESTRYMRDQLLRDADWAGMAHSVEIRVPYVDLRLLEAIAPIFPRLPLGVGKTELANAPSLPLNPEIIARAKSGFGVPIGAWMSGKESGGRSGNEPQSSDKGLVSRQWSHAVMAAFA